MLTAALDDYRRHAELYGPELAPETAAHDLDEREHADGNGEEVKIAGGDGATHVKLQVACGQRR